MGAAITLLLLSEQMRSLVAAALWDFGLTPAAWQMLCWLRVERTESATRLGELTCRPRQESQRLLQRLEVQGFVERLPDMTRDRTGAWTLTLEGVALVSKVSKRLELFDSLLEHEFRDQLPAVIEAVQRIRTVISTTAVTPVGEMMDARLRAIGKLAPPKKWRAVSWDL